MTGGDELGVQSSRHIHGYQIRSSGHSLVHCRREKEDTVAGNSFGKGEARIEVLLAIPPESVTCQGFMHDFITDRLVVLVF